MHFSDSNKIITHTTNTEYFQQWEEQCFDRVGTQAVWQGEGVSVRPLGQVSLLTGDQGPCPALWHSHSLNRERHNSLSQDFSWRSTKRRREKPLLSLLAAPVVLHMWNVLGRLLTWSDLSIGFCWGLFWFLGQLAQSCVLAVWRQSWVFFRMHLLYSSIVSL